MNIQQFETQRKVVEEANRANPATATYGVVFVHGIGSQLQSMPLREQADGLIRWLRRWHDQHPQKDQADRFKVVWSLLSYGTQLKGTPRVKLHIPAYALSEETLKVSRRAMERRRREEEAARQQDRSEQNGEGTHPEATLVDERPKMTFGSQNWVLTEAWWAARLSAPPFGTMLKWAAFAYARAIARLFMIQVRPRQAIVIHVTCRFALSACVFWS